MQLKTVFLDLLLENLVGEILYWSAWVNHLGQSKFKDYKIIIVASTRGRIFLSKRR